MRKTKYSGNEEFIEKVNSYVWEMSAVSIYEVTKKFTLHFETAKRILNILVDREEIFLGADKLIARDGHEYFRNAYQPQA